MVAILRLVFGFTLLACGVLAVNPAARGAEKAQARRAKQAEAGKVVLDELEGVQVSEEMQRMAMSLPEGVTKNLLKSFKVCASCEQFKRLGEAHDGGYLTCMDGLANGQIQAAYSMGVSKSDKWSEHVYALLKTPVNQFDCTVPVPAKMCGGCHFFPACLKASDGGGGMAHETSWTLEEALQQTSQAAAPDRSLLMKMDIEGAEWPILAAGGDVLRKFHQLIFEFHGLSNEDSHTQYYQAMSNLLDAGFSVAHIHGNNYGGMYTKGDYSIPNVIEVTMVSGGANLAACQSDQSYSRLDTKNNAGSPELRMAKLPAD